MKKLGLREPKGSQHQDKLKKMLLLQRREGFRIAGFLFKLDVLLKHYFFFKIRLFHIPLK